MVHLIVLWMQLPFLIQGHDSTLDLSLLGLQERFSGMANKLGLKFDIQRSNQTELSSIFLMCDAFYVEVICQDNGHVNSVKLAQANKQVREEITIVNMGLN